MNSRAMTKSPFQKLGKDSDGFMYPGEEDLSSTPTRAEFGGGGHSPSGGRGIVRTTEVTMTSTTTTTTTHGYASSGDSGTIPDRTRSRGETGNSFV